MINPSSTVSELLDATLAMWPTMPPAEKLADLLYDDADDFRTSLAMELEDLPAAMARWQKLSREYAAKMALMCLRFLEDMGHSLDDVASGLQELAEYYSEHLDADA